MSPSRYRSEVRAPRVAASITPPLPPQTIRHPYQRPPERLGEGDEGPGGLAAADHRDLGTASRHVGSPGRTLNTRSFRMETVPGLAPLGLETKRARVPVIATVPPPRCLLW